MFLGTGAYSESSSYDILLEVLVEPLPVVFAALDDALGGRAAPCGWAAVDADGRCAFVDEVGLTNFNVACTVALAGGAESLLMSCKI
jgi:hypothetical protein